MTRLRTGNNRRRAKAIKGFHHNALRRPIPGRSWNHPATTADKILSDIRSMMSGLYEYRGTALIASDALLESLKP